MSQYEFYPQRYAKLIAGVVVAVVVIGLASFVFKSIPAGNVGVATLFGEVNQSPYDEGLHFPINPLYKWTIYDARQKTITETAGVPSQDQLTTTVEVSVQYRIDRSMAATILQETGTVEQAISVHLIPKLRSILREQGKTIKRAEDFFLEETHQQLQVSLTDALRDFLIPKGIIVENVLIRDVRLPPFIVKAIESKKEREQAAARERAELERYETEQQQIVAAAKAERAAAELDAEKIQLLADAQAYEIEKINQAIAGNQAYIQLQALQALQAISKDPAAKIYFMNGDSPMPLPLMHMGIGDGALSSAP